MGAVHIMYDINGRPNISGDTINYCQRIMDAANPNQVLFSETAYHHYIGTQNLEITDPPFSEKSSACFRGPVTVFAKHGLPIKVYVMHIKGDESERWDDSDPKSRDQQIVSLTPLPIAVTGGSWF